MREQDHVTVRTATAADVPLLRAMLFEAAFWDPGRPRPAQEEALADPHLALYVDGWGRPGDVGVVAEDGEGQPVGAAWFRLFEPDAPGYGFVDAGTPEVSIGVVAEWRGRGAGGALLDGLAVMAHAAGFGALSLSVERANPAARLYRRHGYVVVDELGGAWTMRLDLAT